MSDAPLPVVIAKWTEADYPKLKAHRCEPGRRKIDNKLSVTAVGRLLAELDITPQKPLRRAYERDRS